MTALVIKDDDRWPGTIQLGWRFEFKDGNSYDMFWGNTRDDGSLCRLLEDPEWKDHMPEAVIDERVRTKGTKPLTLPAWWGDIAVNLGGET